MLRSHQNVHVQQLVRAAKHYCHMNGGTKPINTKTNYGTVLPY
jgi:hypothetical protein